eukprot:3579890-Amphidinium_carterae.1
MWCTALCCMRDRRLPHTAHQQLLLNVAIPLAGQGGVFDLKFLPQHLSQPGTRGDAPWTAEGNLEGTSMLYTDGRALDTACSQVRRAGWAVTCFTPASTQQGTLYGADPVGPLQTAPYGELYALSLQHVGKVVPASPRGHIWQDIVHERHGRLVHFQLIKAHRAQPDPSAGAAYTNWLGNHLADKFAKTGANMCPTDASFGTLGSHPGGTHACVKASKGMDCEALEGGISQRNQHHPTVPQRQRWVALEWIRQLSDLALEQCDDLHLLAPPCALYPT